MIGGKLGKNKPRTVKNKDRGDFLEIYKERSGRA